jgi:hypothetical protein
MLFDTHFLTLRSQLTFHILILRFPLLHKGARDEGSKVADRRRFWFRMSDRTLAVLAVTFCGFALSLQVNGGLVS